MFLIRIFVLIFPFALLAQSGKKNEKIQKDTLIVVEKAPEKGFFHDYLLFVPKGTSRSKFRYLLVESNNTGRTSDSISVHKDSAIHTASKSSVGNNVSTALQIPFLVPIFPRPNFMELVYTHALDRDVMLEKSGDLKRLDLQLIAMISDARVRLQSIGVNVHEKILINGFSASGTFANRFVFLHPEMVRAAAMGGINGNLMLPFEKEFRANLNYPIGTADFRKISGGKFDVEAYKKVPQFIYMGALDNNNAVQYDDAFDDAERTLINLKFGKTVAERWPIMQRHYNEHNVNASFTTYPEVGHWTTAGVNLDVILFFDRIIKQ